MAKRRCVFWLVAVILVCPLGGAQQTDALRSGADGAATIRLEPHNHQTEFRLGDPIVLDLVFAAQSPGYVVRTDTGPYLPTEDAVILYPAEGWIRSHSSYRGRPQDGNATVDLRANPVRVPVLLNRTITFQKPGRYEVSIETERLRTAQTAGIQSSLEVCQACYTTNAVSIEMVVRGAHEEAALVVSLSKELENGERDEQKPEEPPEDQKALQRELVTALEKTGTSDAESPEKMEALVRRAGDFTKARMAKEQARADRQREAALRLAYLGGDDAVRAKVHFISDDVEGGEAGPISPIMVDGLPSSRNFALQLDLLEAVWRDPTHVPTSELQTALREAKELVGTGHVTDDGLMWAGTEQERLVTGAKYQAELDEVIATLPQRTEENRSKTIAFLKTRAVAQHIP